MTPFKQQGAKSRTANLEDQTSRERRRVGGRAWPQDLPRTRTSIGME